MKRTWKTFLTGGAIGLAVGSYLMSRMRGNDNNMAFMTDNERNTKRGVSDAMAGFASHAADRLDDLSLRARTLNNRYDN